MQIAWLFRVGRFRLFLPTKFSTLPTNFNAGLARKEGIFEGPRVGIPLKDISETWTFFFQRNTERITFLLLILLVFPPVV